MNLTLTCCSVSTEYTCGTANSTTSSTGAVGTASRNNTTSRTINNPSLGSISMTGTGFQPSASISISSSHGRNLSVTAHRPPPITSYAPSYSSERKDKRQTQAFTTPRCLKRFVQTFGATAVSGACDCLDIKTPTPVTITIIVTDPRNTSTTSTERVRAWIDTLRQ